MRISASARYAFVMSAASGMLAGCSGGSQEGGSPTLSNSQRQQSASTVFSPRNARVQEERSNRYHTAYGFERDNRTNQPAVCTLGPFVSVNSGIGVDRSGNLWVPDMGANLKTSRMYA